jgi:hypothetical protein
MYMAEKFQKRFEKLTKHGLDNCVSSGELISWINRVKIATQELKVLYTDTIRPDLSERPIMFYFTDSSLLYVENSSQITDPCHVRAITKKHDDYDKQLAEMDA